MKARHSCMLILVATLVSACGGGGADQAAAAAQPQEKGGADHLRQAVQQPLERAREVETLSLQRKDQIDRQLDQAQSGDDD